jgi:hypothetical protein
VVLFGDASGNNFNGKGRQNGHQVEGIWGFEKVNGGVLLLTFSKAHIGTVYPTATLRQAQDDNEYLLFITASVYTTLIKRICKG